MIFAVGQHECRSWHGFHYGGQQRGLITTLRRTILTNRRIKAPLFAYGYGGDGIIESGCQSELNLASEILAYVNSRICIIME
jgi:hypothetical protein